MTHEVLLAHDHMGMRISHTGLLMQVCDALTRHGEDGLVEMLHQLHRHLTELGKRWYTGDAYVVDEFLQLYCVESEARQLIKDAGLVAQEEHIKYAKLNPPETAPKGETLILADFGCGYWQTAIWNQEYQLAGGKQGAWMVSVCSSERCEDRRLDFEFLSEFRTTEEMRGWLPMPSPPPRSSLVMDDPKMGNAA